MLYHFDHFDHFEALDISQKVQKLIFHSKNNLCFMDSFNLLWILENSIHYLALAYCIKNATHLLELKRWIQRIFSLISTSRLFPKYCWNNVLIFRFDAIFLHTYHISWDSSEDWHSIRLYDPLPWLQQLNIICSAVIVTTFNGAIDHKIISKMIFGFRIFSVRMHTPHAFGKPRTIDAWNSWTVKSG